MNNAASGENTDKLRAILAQLDSTGTSVQNYKQALANADLALLHVYKQTGDIRQVIFHKSLFIDQLLRRLWQEIVTDDDSRPICLIAVGGYGRQELHPHSDIDILILTDTAFTSLDTQIGEFITLLWDIGLDIGHSVRDVPCCIQEAHANISTMTNLLESRRLIGLSALFHKLTNAITQDKVWSLAEFFHAKRKELRERYVTYQDTAYRLEPNIKESPGGLRDIHTIQWLLIRQYASADLTQLVTDRYLTPDELNELTAARDHLWQIRFQLHHMGRRKEDRLLFDYQRSLAETLKLVNETDAGYSNAAVEQFMQQYYRTVTRVERLTNMLLQLMESAFVTNDSQALGRKVNKRFVVRNRYLEAAHEKIFINYPPALLEIFQIYANDEDILGIGANTLRLLRSHLHLIDHRFRSDMIARDLFMQLFREPHKITRKLRMMNRYGVLAMYIPAFEKIVGRMQYDLFHIYTVDEHTLMVIRNLRRFALHEHYAEYPICSALMGSIDKPELLYIIALFHDIAKGRNGDHSVLGAEDARSFCAAHALLPSDTRLVVWCVRHHLDMSTTAQRQDISDPEVILEFAQLVGSIQYLNFLYLLTVADIRGTNPDLWNSWKENLLLQLYESTRKALQRGLDNPLDKLQIIEEKKLDARKLLKTSAVDAAAVERLWARWEDSYFLQYSVDEIVWHALNVTRFDEPLPLVLIRHETQRGSTEIFLHSQDHQLLFSTIAYVLNRLNLTIVSAQVLTSPAKLSLDTFFVLDATGSPVFEISRLQSIHDQLVNALTNSLNKPKLQPLPAPRRLQHFSVAPVVEFDNEFSDYFTSLFIVAIDRPGLLSAIGHALAEHDVRVVAANISTFGEKAEDVFHLLDAQNRKIVDPARLDQMYHSLKRQLTPD